jgi:hypothetical protein
MSASILLFYSEKCPHCRQFLSECQQNGITSFHKVCVDNTPRERIPITVKSVPSLVFAGSNQCLQNERAFQWLKQQVHEQQQRRQTQQQSSVGSGGGSSGSGGEPSAWQSTEMGASFSDTYSFLDNSFTESGTGQPLKENTGGSGSTIPKNFAFLEGASFASNPPHQQQQQQNVPTNMRGMASQPPPMTNQHQPQRNGAPSGYGTMPPTASMAPPSNRPETDELSKRMESFRMSREQDVPQGMQRIS